VKPIRLAFLAFATAVSATPAAEPYAFDPTVFGLDDPRTKEFSRRMPSDAERRMKAANLAESAAFESLKTRQEWESHRDLRIDALRKSLGKFPPPPGRMPVHVTGTHRGDGFEIQNILYESRPGWFVPANLYLPPERPAKMPGILISHSHHTSKTHGELQDMGMTWARTGCAVLVPDHVGYGERREHPFNTEKDYPAPFRVGRQDYYHRYTNNLMLQAAGESLMGWMVWDLMRGVDVLLKQPNIDPERIVLLGAVAGGGDPAGVTAALDQRIACVAPFNFGGWQPESRALENPARDFAWFGDGYWESTRGLRGGAAGGFAHYVIVGSVAPRKVIYGHEFAWSAETDPAWPRLQKIFGLYDAKANIVPVHGSGKVTGQPPESTHCTHIGPVHRAGIHKAFADWFGMPIPKEYSKRVTSGDLKCWNDVADRAGIRRKPLAEMVNGMLNDRTAPVAIDSARRWKVESSAAGKPESVPAATLERCVLHGTSDRESLPGIDLPLFLMLPKGQTGASPCVVMVATAGKKGFLEQRREVVNAFLNAGVAVALVDVRGTGETLPGKSGDRGSTRTSISQTNLILGTPVLAGQLADLHAAVDWLKTRKEIDADKFGVWGDSFAEPNADARDVEHPFDSVKARIGEPAGAWLAERADGFKARYARGGIGKTDTMFPSAFVAIPHDAVIPGFATPAESNAPCRREGEIDVRNIRTDNKPIEPLKSAEWVVRQLKR
jgi:cephalosporin-C deacetylase-like acetyl esterase